MGPTALDGIDVSTRACHEWWMEAAIAQATAAGEAGEVPVGAVLVTDDQTLLATGQNRKERDQDPTAHAEILAIRAGCAQIGHWRLTHCTLYVTLEPCPMCAGAILQARLGMLVYGTPDPKTGAIHSAMNLPQSPASYHRLTAIGGICAEPCRRQLQDWFALHRRLHPRQRHKNKQPLPGTKKDPGRNRGHI